MRPYSAMNAADALTAPAACTRAAASGYSPIVADADIPAIAANPRLHPSSVQRSRRSPSRVMVGIPTSVSGMLAVLRLARRPRSIGVAGAVVAQEQLLKGGWLAGQRLQARGRQGPQERVEALGFD